MAAFKIILMVWLSAIVWACRSVPHQADITAPQTSRVAMLPVPNIPKVTPDLDAVIPELTKKHVVFVGETHDRYEHHLVQLDIIRRLHASHPDLVIGMEFFQRPFQPYLDAFIAGDLDEQAFLRKTEYFQRWGFDYRLYRPIMDYARSQNIPVLALNVPSEMLRRVAEAGLAGLNAKEKAQIPAQIDQSDALYRKRLREIYRQHGRGGDKAGFERFWQAQLLWDETMAETAADYLQKHPGRPIVILAGSGHLAYGLGIPQRLIRRLPVTTAIVINGESKEASDPKMADYVLIPEKVDLPPAGRLGIAMEQGAAGVNIRDVQPNGGAERAGLQRGDQIVELNDQPVANPDDINIALLDKRPGDPVSLLIRRKDEDLRATVLLSAPSL